MKRETQIRILFVLNQLVPPLLRDSWWLMALPFRAVFGAEYQRVASFKERVLGMSDEEFVETNRATIKAARVQNAETDLNEPCRERILADARGTVLEVGCGAGHLAAALRREHAVTACDILVSDDLRRREPQITFHEANAEQLPFADRAFDTVVCTHALEHVLDFEAAVSELRRVTRDLLIVVVPMERPYRYTFNLHVRFFPYPHSLLHAMRARLHEGRCEVLGGDLYYMERRLTAAGRA